MAIEKAIIEAKHKPWGSTHLLPWSNISTAHGPIGELWFQRKDATAPTSKLLLKLLFTTEPLSIQVHPDDDYARSIGLESGKTEAWYILSAAPQAQVAVGLKHSISAEALRAAIKDGSIVDIVRWRSVQKDDVIFVPAGTIHAIGAGIILAEVQQRSDSTFRLFDYGRDRELHIDGAIAVAKLEPADGERGAEQPNGATTALVINPHFVLERIDCRPGSGWVLSSPQETWMLVIEGEVRIGTMLLSTGDALFLDSEQADIHVGADGLRALLVYPGSNLSSATLMALCNSSHDVAKRDPARATFKRLQSDDPLLGKPGAQP